MCEPRCRVWESVHPGDCVHVTKVKVLVRWGHHGECGCVTPGVWSGRGGYPGNWKCDPRYRVWVRCHQGDRGHLTPGAFISKGYPLVCGCVTPGERSGSRDHPELWSSNTRCRVWEEGSPWRLWTCDPRCRFCEVFSPWRKWTSDPKCSVWGRG